MQSKHRHQNDASVHISPLLKHSHDEFCKYYYVNDWTYQERIRLAAQNLQAALPQTEATTSLVTASWELLYTIMTIKELKFSYTFVIILLKFLLFHSICKELLALCILLFHKLAAKMKWMAGYYYGRKKRTDTIVNLRIAIKSQYETRGLFFPNYCVTEQGCCHTAFK